MMAGYNSVMRKFGLQLYTVRDAINSDVAGTLRHVAESGYKHLELAGSMGGLDLKQFHSLIDGLGLSVMGGHVNTATCTDDIALQKQCADLAKLGAKTVALAWIGPEFRGSVANWTRAAALLNTAGKAARSHGLTMMYHNHDFEFETLENGRIGLDVIWAESDPDLVQAELDVYWVQKAGRDPATYLTQLGARARVVHIKDMTKDTERTFEIIGDGVLDFAKILAAADAAGSDWLIVEQDKCPHGELISSRKSYKNIVSRGWL